MKCDARAESEYDFYGRRKKEGEGGHKSGFLKIPAAAAAAASDAAARLRAGIALGISDPKLLYMCLV